MLCFKKKLLTCNRENISAKELDHRKQHCSTQLELKGIKMAESKIIRLWTEDTLEKNKSPWEKENA